MYSFQHISSPIVAEAASVFYKALALGFLVSAWAKVRNIEAFRSICASYPGAARVGIRTVSSTVLVGEFALGVTMLTPHCLSNWLGLAAALLWVTVATAAIALRRIHGEKKFRCGCGADLFEESSAIWLLVRNALIMVGLFFAAAASSCSTAGFRETMTQSLAAVSLLLGMQLLTAADLTWRKVREWRTVG